MVPSGIPATALAPNSACVSNRSARRPPGFVTPICAPFGSADSESRIEPATRLPSADSDARSSREPPVHTPLTNEPPTYAVVMSPDICATAVLPTSAALASACVTMSFTAETRGYVVMSSAAGVVVRATFS